MTFVAVLGPTKFQPEFIVAVLGERGKVCAALSSSASISNAPARLTIIASRTRYGLLHYLDREESIIDHFFKVFAPRCDLQGELLDVKR
jgi:hypothetical protein